MKIPRHILKISQLGLEEKVLLGHMRSFRERGCWQSNQILAETLMVSVPMIRLWLGRLKDYTHVANPRGYYCTIWAGEVLRNAQGPAQERGADLHKSVDPLAHGRAATNTNTITENNRRTIASPPPLPAGGQARATLKDRTRKDIAVIEHFKATFGRPKVRDYRLLTLEQFESRRAAVLEGLRRPRPAVNSKATPEIRKETQP
ncbi:MAG: hypothetical protein JSU70_18320 [Phycisphaerales bacterium]|nr:MAG: hypothetical protein JSU70_18320 [Phycisphaerales bacterium]